MNRDEEKKPTQSLEIIEQIPLRLFLFFFLCRYNTHTHKYMRDKIHENKKFSIMSRLSIKMKNEG